jgi:phosphatidylserine decarboxylase
MAEVSSCVATVKIGQHVRKGSDLGHFAFGGSTHLLIFQKKTKLKFTEKLYSKINEENVGNQQYLRSYLAHVVK